jgi:excisionase family DNA binding protein
VRKERPDEIPKRPQKRLYTLKEAAEYLGRSDWAMRELMWKGAIPYVRDGRKIYFDIVDLDEFVEKNKAKF